MEVKLKTPLSDETKKLRIGDIVHISGKIFTARDRAHEKMIREGPPYKLEGTVIFHAGPIIKYREQPKKEEIIENPQADLIVIGPTTSTRMNPYQPRIINMGVKAIIGKGGMDKNVQNALKKNSAVYLAAVGGCAALYATKVKRVTRVYWPNLGIPEAIWELEVQDFGPLIVAMDAKGGNLYEKIKD
ncbi:MAG TPA: FumA C-terminus/TtdB family hydratase beta subunit [Methanothermobacter sp.]|nr:fumarate hydratase [Methanothermobacter sp. MT-2]HHW04322.1 fumarate hydratase [Methanothermobacter sp.]HOK72364.1 FumA C-terminus/TtdB family hydratase beta subunit [Methanothermobacter sp.]HOL69233.1 FumA C-terminus/TtdB family hydratase beta subunit [Methanothermobacter sp.]HPQ03851.1 FumA C-terminus/TtdB family hydratase beta subunit [Methanothermobacter sp.]